MVRPITTAYNRWDEIAQGPLHYPVALHRTPPHSHSIVLKHDNALIYRGKSFR